MPIKYPGMNMNNKCQTPKEKDGKCAKMSDCNPEICTSQRKEEQLSYSGKSFKYMYKDFFSPFFLQGFCVWNGV